jgi:hypothetical protein
VNSPRLTFRDIIEGLCAAVIVAILAVLFYWFVIVLFDVATGGWQID